MMPMQVLLPFLFAASSLGCSYFEVQQKEAGLVIGRSMELGDVIGHDNMDWRVVVHSRAHQKDQGSGNTTFGYVSIDGMGWKWVPDGLGILTTEGLNEKGLSVSANTLHMSVYESRKSKKSTHILWWNVVKFLLGNFATVKEAIAGLKEVAVTGAFEFVCNEGACFHWAVADASGNSAIIEFLKGEMVVHEGPTQHLGLMTNDPDLDWQITNLNQYVNLRPDYPTSNKQIEHKLETGVFPRAPGHGMNLAGLPADGSPASRFVRMFYLREYAMTNYPQSVASRENAIALATGLLNNVYLVKGSIAKKNALDAFEFTPWATIKIPQEGSFMYRTATDMSWKQISLKSLDFDKPHADIKLSMEDLGIQDVTSQLAPKQSSSPTVV